MGKKGYFTDCKGNKSLTRLLLFISSMVGYVVLIIGVVMISLGVDKADVIIIAAAGLIYGGNMAKKYQQENMYIRGNNDQTTGL